MTTHARTRAGSSALVPGITLWREERPDGVRWRLRASRMEGERQRLKTWGLVQHGLAGALQQAAAWRYEVAPGGWESAEAMAEAARAAIPRETLDPLRAAGVEVDHSPINSES